MPRKTELKALLLILGGFVLVYYLPVESLAAFLYAGPAINVLAVVLTARVLGLELGVARAVGAISFSIVIGLLMHLLFRREEAATRAAFAGDPVGNGLAVLVLGALGASLIAAPMVRRRRRHAGAPGWSFPALALVGLGIAAYLGYVEITGAEAVRTARAALTRCAASRDPTSPAFP